jgi:biofilm PGA synthesis N-glycosyltransferase PgaC
MKTQIPTTLLAWLGLAVVALCAVGLVLIGPAIAPEDLLRGTTVILLIFVVVLMLRFVLLLWLGYLHHIETVLRKPDDAEAAFTPPVSVIVPAFNEGRTIEPALRALLRQNYPAYEVIVVDDGSTDDTYERASAYEGFWGSGTIRVFRKSNSGKAAALNYGLQIAHYPFVVCMDADSKLTENTLRRAVRHFRDPEVAAVAGNVKVVNRTSFWARIQALEYIEGLNLARRAQGFLRAVNIVPGPIGMFRRDVLMRLGGYDTDTFAEDADLTLKILAAGYRIEYEDAAVAYTEAPESLNALIQQRYRWTRGVLQALRKRSRVLFHPQNAASWVSVVMMSFESLVWPFLNVFGTLFFVAVALSFHGGSYLLAWWLLLTLLDAAAALHTVVMEGEDLRLVPLALIYRFVFVLLIDVTKLFATVEEFLSVQMTWGKLERLGRIT